MIFSHFKHYFIFLNVNEHLTITFVVGPEWTISVPLFTLDYLSEHFFSHTSLVLLIARNLPCILLSVCLYV